LLEQASVCAGAEFAAGLKVSKAIMILSLMSNFSLCLKLTTQLEVVFHKVTPPTLYTNSWGQRWKKIRNL